MRNFEKMNSLMGAEPIGTGGRNASEPHFARNRKFVD